MSPKALEISVSFSTTRNFLFEKEIVRQAVLISSVRKNFVKADWFIGTSQIPTLKFPPYSILNYIQPLNSNILFIVDQRKKLPTLFLYKSKPQDDYGVPFFQNSFTKEGLSALVQLLTFWFNSDWLNKIMCSAVRVRPFFTSLLPKAIAVSCKTIYIYSKKFKHHFESNRQHYVKLWENSNNILSLEEAIDFHWFKKCFAWVV